MVLLALEPPRLQILGVAGFPCRFLASQLAAGRRASIAVYNQVFMRTRIIREGWRFRPGRAGRAGLFLRLPAPSVSRRYLLAFLVLQVLAQPAAAQRDPEVDVRARLFAEVTAGVAGLKSRTVGQGEKAERLYYVLLPELRTAGASGATVLVYRADGTRVAQIPAPVARGGQPAAAASEADLQAVAPAAPLVVYGYDFDVDAAGRVFIADRAANAVRIFTPDGTPGGSISVAAPSSVAALSTGEVAVASLRSNRLITVYAEVADAVSGRPVWRAVREFGERAEIADPKEAADLNRFLNIGRLARDAEDGLYYAFAYAPEPTVRKYDAYGYKLFEAELATLDYLALAQNARRNIDRLGQSRFTLGPIINPGYKATVTAVAADPQSREVFVAIGGQLLHFDREGNRRQTYRLFTQRGVRVEASALLVEAGRLIVGSETQGIFEFPRPDKPAAAAPPVPR